MSGLGMVVSLAAGLGLFVGCVLFFELRTKPVNSRITVVRRRDMAQLDSPLAHDGDRRACTDASDYRVLIHSELKRSR